MDLIVTMSEHYIWHVGQLIQRATRLDDGQLDAPIELSVEGIDDDPTTPFGAFPARRPDGHLEPRGGKPSL